MRELMFQLVCEVDYNNSLKRNMSLFHLFCSAYRIDLLYHSLVSSIHIIELL